MTNNLFQCPSCGAPVLPRGSASVLNCPYCHASVVVPKELRQETDGNWSTIAFDGFVSNHHDWLVGNENSDYFAPLQRTLGEGRYRWEAKVTEKAPSISTAWLKGYPVSDFHLIANCKHILGSRAGSGWGLVFRVLDGKNYYHFHIIDDRQFAFSAYVNGKWETPVNWTSSNAIKLNGVNQLEVVASGQHFSFLINGKLVSETEDNTFQQGLVGLAVEGYKAGEQIAFDFLDITLRAP